MTPDELEYIIARAAEGTLPAEDAARLLAACRADAAVLDTLVLHLGTERLLHAVERDPSGHIAAQEITLRLEQERVAAVTEPTFIPRTLENVQRRVWFARLAIAAAVFFFASVAAVFFKKTPAAVEPPFLAEGPTSERAATPVPLALLKRAVGIVWTDPASAPAVGSMLPAGWVKFHKGTLQLEFLSGARLLVEGPAELRLDSETSAFLASGKASAYVPEPAHGFTLRVQGMDVVDLGTAFGVDASPGKKPEVHVFDGEVSIAPTAAEPRKVEAEKAVRLDGSELRDIPPMPANFPDGEQFSKRADSAGRESFRTWKKAAATLAADPATIIAYHFDNDAEWSRTVSNQATEAGTDTQAALVGAGWTGGRWPGKRGLEFRSLGDRLRFTAPGEHRALTMLAWVRVDSLPNDYNSLLLPTHYTAGSLHWTLERGGELRLTMLNNPRRPISADGWDGPVSGPAVTNMDFGRWLFLATTYDAATGTVAHFRDGQPIGTAQFKHRLPAVLGDVEFGNWGADATAPDNTWILRQLRNQRTRNFVGRLDELTVLTRVLSAEEIATLYSVGMP